MHKGVTHVTPDTLLSKVATQMRDADVGAIPIRSNGSLVGIVTDRDIVCRAVADGRDAGRMTAKDVMSAEVAFCGPEDDIGTAIKTMETKQIRRLPVIDSARNIVGMLSLGDISHKVGDDLSGEMLRAVSAHHR
jgi:CBS domain-containing protein